MNAGKPVCVRSSASELMTTIFNADYLCYRTCMKKNSEKLNGNKFQSCNLFLAFNDCDRSSNEWN